MTFETLTDASGIAIASPEGDISFEGLRERVRAGLRAASSDREEPIGPVLRLDADRSPEFVIRFLTAFESGVPVAIFSPGWTEEERAKRAALLDACRGSVDPATALILFTSGSSGEPKAVQLSREGILANTRAIRERLDFAGVFEQTLYLPLSYSYGLLGQLLPALAAGIPTRLLPDFLALRPVFESADGPSGMWSGVASHWSAVVRMFSRSRPFSRVTHLVSAGARLDPALKRALCDLFPAAVLYDNYGQTEASPRILSMPSTDPRFFEAVTGYAVPGISVRLSVEGELEAKGPQVMRGYLGDPAGTADRLRDGWLRTGDRAAIDESGLVTVLGRLDDLVKIGGERISPHEVEAAVMARGWTPEACVVAVDDELYGTKLILFLGGDSTALPKDGEVLRSLRETLSPAKLPSRIVRIAELPRNGNGKLDRRRMKESVAPGRVEGSNS